MTERLQFHSLLENFEDRNTEAWCKTPTLAVWMHARRSETVNMQFDDLKNVFHLRDWFKQTSSKRPNQFPKFGPLEISCEYDLSASSLKPKI